MKILFFIDTLTGGGAEKVLRMLVNNMDREKFQITVHTTEYTDPSGILEPHIRYKAINRCRTAIGKKLFSCWVRLCAELKWLYPLYIRDDYDVEVAYLECGPTKFLAGSTNKKAKKLAWVHCDLEKRCPANPGKMKAQYDAYDKVVCVSQTVKHSFQSVIGSSTDSVILYNVNDEADILQKSKAFPVEKPGQITFTTVGRLSYEKGNDRLIEACKMLKNAGLDFRLWLVGDGAEKENLLMQVRNCGLEDRVTFWGFQRNPYPYMRAADVIVTPSRYEGFSTVVTEAMILGKPVVTTPCSGMDELLGDNEFGLITADTAEGIYAGMRRMLEDASLRESYARKALARGRDFSKEKLVTQTERFFEELLK